MLFSLTPWIWSVLQTSLIAVVALLIVGLLRGRHPQWASAILAGASLAAVMLMLQVGFPKSQWSLLDIDVQTASSLSTNVSRKTQSDSSGSATLAPVPTEDAGPATYSSTTFQEIAPATSIGLSQWIRSLAGWMSKEVQQIDDSVRRYEDSQASWWSRFTQVQVALLSVLLVLSGFWLISWQWMRRLIRDSDRIEDAELQARLSRHAARLGISQAPQLRSSGRVAVGAIVGLHRHWLIINSNWHNWSHDELDSVLLHELAHLLRRDFAWVLISSWVRVLFFYHPLMQLLVRRWRMEQELAADQLAASMMASTKVYGRALASLALRAQSSARLPGSMLAAEQVCIVRRVTMLRQGSLKPSSYRWSWVAVVTALTTIGMMPLSGLRGSMVMVDEPSDKVVAEEPANGTTRTLTEEQRQQLLEFRQTQELFPPFQIEGRLKWSPGRLNSERSDLCSRYLQDLVAFALFEQFSTTAELNCPATISMKWEDLKREHGRVELGAMANEAHGLDPKLLSRLISSPLLGHYKASSLKKTIEGFEAVGLVAKQWDAEAKNFGYEDEPSKWLIQSGEHFYYGTETEVVETIRRSQEIRHPQDKVAVYEIPSEFQADYHDAAVALVYSDCQEWPQRIRKHFDGTPRRAEFAIVYPFLEGLTRIGLFFHGNEKSIATLRIGYDSAESAQRGAKGIGGLLALAKSSKDQHPFIATLLEKAILSVHAEEIHLQLNDSAVVKLACQAILPEKMPGWHCVLGDVVGASESAKWINGKLITEQGIDAGTIKFASEHPFCSTAFLAQSVQGQDYQGKRVRISAELGAETYLHDRCGVILWGSDSNLATIGNAASGSSIGVPVEPAKVLTERQNEGKEANIEWRSHVVQWNVPPSTEIVSLGVYVAAGEVLVRNVKFEVVGSTGDSISSSSLANLPRNLLCVPGFELRASPVNLDFRQGVAESQTPEVTRSAKVQVEATSR